MNELIGNLQAEIERLKTIIENQKTIIQAERVEKAALVDACREACNKAHASAEEALVLTETLIEADSAVVAKIIDSDEPLRIKGGLEKGYVRRVLDAAIPHICMVLGLQVSGDSSEMIH